MAGVDKIAKLIQTMFTKSPYNVAAGITTVKVVAAENGQVDTELKLGPEHLNLQGTFHGGMAASLLDVMTVLPLHLTTDSNYYLSVVINVRFLASAKLNDVVLMKSRVLKLGKTLAFTEATFINKTTNKIILEGNQTHFVRKRSSLQLSYG